MEIKCHTEETIKKFQKVWQSEIKDNSPALTNANALRGRSKLKEGCTTKKKRNDKLYVC